MNPANDGTPAQRKKSEKQRRLGPAPIASFEMSFDDSTNNEVRPKVCNFQCDTKKTSILHPYFNSYLHRMYL